MSGVNIEERTIQFLKQHTGGVSKAVWPSSVRRYVATGKGRRRFMILKRFLLFHRLRTLDFLHTFDKVRVFSKRLLATYSCTIHVMIIVVASDIIQMLCMLYNWLVLFVLTVICTTTSLMVIHLASDNVQKGQKYQKCSFVFKNKFKVIRLRKEKRRLIKSRLADSSLASILYTEDKDEEIEQESMLILFPDTPMPKTPLIRVLETINLSSTELGHSQALQDLSVVKSTREGRDQHIGLSPQE